MGKVKGITAGYTVYGYWVEAFVAGGHVEKREDFGNSPYESTTVIPVRDGGTLAVDNIKAKAERTALDMAEEFGLSAEDVSVFHDTDGEASLREERTRRRTCAESQKAHIGQPRDVTGQLRNQENRPVRWS